MSQLEYALYNSAQIRTCEQQTPRLYHFDDYQLMLQAGTEAFFFFLRTFPQVRYLAVFCGSGNNAGDGYVLARLAQKHGLNVVVYQCKAIEDLPEIAQKAALEAQDAGVDLQSADEPLDPEIELIVDALLGIGLRGPVYGMIAAAVQQINSSGLPVLSLDIPSGLNADSGRVANVCVQATMTLTFIGQKTGMYTLDGPDYCGEIHCHHLKLEPYLAGIKPFACLLNKNNVVLPLPKRNRNSHKGEFGHVVIIGGGVGMPGAVALAARATMRAGAGAVSIATRVEHVAAVLPLVPEAMVWGIDEPEELRALLAKATFCIVGPGLGESEWATALFLAAISSQLPMIIDASGLRLLAQYPQMDDNWILTPHPGEAASLLSCSSQEVQEDRCRSAALIQQQYGGVVVLKGAGSIIQTLEKNVFLCPKGNPGMASAGMGDVLSGIIAGLCAQGLALSEAAKLGVWVHAVAADAVTQEQGEAGLLASDLLNRLPNILNGITHDS